MVCRKGPSRQIFSPDNTTEYCNPSPDYIWRGIDILANVRCPCLGDVGLFILVPAAFAIGHGGSFNLSGCRETGNASILGPQASTTEDVASGETKVQEGHASSAKASSEATTMAAAQAGGQGKAAPKAKAPRKMEPAAHAGRHPEEGSERCIERGEFCLHVQS